MFSLETSLCFTSVLWKDVFISQCFVYFYLVRIIRKLHWFKKKMNMMYAMKIFRNGFRQKILYYYYIFFLLFVKISHILTNIEDILTIIPHFYILVLILTLNIIFALGRTFTEYSCLLRECGQGGGRGTCWKPADLVLYAVPVFENYPQFCARIYRPSFHENKPKTLVFT